MHPNDDTLHVTTDSYIGKTFDKYKLLARLGAGGMGLVYRAEQARIKRQVAVKILPFSLLGDEVNIKRIEREAHAMGNLRHPNIATIFDFGFSEEGQPYLVMELIEGESLGSLLGDVGRLPVKQAVNIMAQVADAMDYAHKQGIIHRDLKPENIMLDCGHAEDFVKILDFGIAKYDESAAPGAPNSQTLTRPGTMIGSPLYMSPEQCMGSKLDSKSDIYALGVILYESLTGTVPCGGATIYETIGKKTTEQPPPFPPDLSGLKDLEALTLKCLAPLRTNRPESMQVVKEGLLSSTKDITDEVPVAETKLEAPRLQTNETPGLERTAADPVSAKLLAETVSTTPEMKQTAVESKNSVPDFLKSKVTLIVLSVIGLLVVATGITFALFSVFDTTRTISKQDVTIPVGSPATTNATSADDLMGVEQDNPVSAATEKHAVAAPAVAPRAKPAARARSTPRWKSAQSASPAQYAEPMPVAQPIAEPMQTAEPIPTAPPIVRAEPRPKAKKKRASYSNPDADDVSSVMHTVKKTKHIPKHLKRFWNHLKNGSF